MFLVYTVKWRLKQWTTYTVYSQLYMSTKFTKARVIQLVVFTVYLVQYMYKYTCKYLNMVMSMSTCNLLLQSSSQLLPCLAQPSAVL